LTARSGRYSLPRRARASIPCLTRSRELPPRLVRQQARGLSWFPLAHLTPAAADRPEHCRRSNQRAYDEGRPLSSSVFMSFMRVPFHSDAPLIAVCKFDAGGLKRGADCAEVVRHRRAGPSLEVDNDVPRDDGSAPGKATMPAISLWRSREDGPRRQGEEQETKGNSR